MPSLTLPLAPEGARVKVEIGWSKSEVRAARRLGRPIPPPLQGRALIDSGAETSCLDSALIQQLGLPFGGLSLVNVPALGGLSISPSHDINLTVLHPTNQPGLNLVLTDLLVFDLDLGTLGYQALLGRDVLTLCRWLYDGPGNRFKLQY